MIEVKGKADIVARILADSINEQGNRLTTWEVEYPRLIHSELMTHRMFSRNAASSRAIPFAKMVEQLNGSPVRFGANQSGMQDTGEDYNEGVLGWPVEYDGNSGAPLWTAAEAWNEAKEHAIYFAKAFAEAGYHKQITGRLTEPFQMMKTIISATETANFFWLRDDKAADPTIAELARVMKEAQEQSVPELLRAGEYHVPYIDIWYDHAVGMRGYSIDIEGEPRTLTVEQAIKVSCARCAAVSYRNEGYGLEKSLEVYERLLGSDKKHASAFEHVATPQTVKVDYNAFVRTGKEQCNDPASPTTWQPGISHADRNGRLWSGNFCGWIQYRKTIDGENYSA
jgi:thymidylate synthase ThyX